MNNIYIQVSQFGGPEVLKVMNGNITEPKAYEVRIKVLYTGVSFADVMMREGVYPHNPSPPFIPGYEIIGIVDEMGEGVEGNLKIGDVVGALTIVGGYSSYINLDYNEAIKIIPDIELTEALCLFLNYVTAYQMLNRIIKINGNKKILVHGASGGVGLALVELAKKKQLKVYGTASQSSHLHLEKLGVIPIDYKSQDFVTYMQKVEPNGIDAVFDPIGNDNWLKSSEILAPTGLLVGYGNSSIVDSKQNGIDEHFLKGRTPQGNQFYMFSLSKLKKEKPEWYKSDVNNLMNMLKNKELKPAISKIYRLEEALEAHLYMRQSAKMGKVLLTCL